MEKMDIKPGNIRIRHVKDLSQKWERLSKERRIAIGIRDLICYTNNIPRSVLIESFIDRKLMARLRDRESDPLFGAIGQNAIPVDPAGFDILNVIVDDEHIALVDQLKIAEIREEVGLHYGNDHDLRAIPQADLTELFVACSN